MPVPAGQMRSVMEEQRRRFHPEPRCHRLPWWPVLVATCAFLAFGLQGGKVVQAEETASADLLVRIRDLESRIRSLEEDQERLRRALLTFEVPAKFTFAGESVPLHLWDVRERLEREVLLSLQDRGQVLLWLKRASRYFPFIEAALRRARLPEDLKYVSVIESALLPQALSRADARGIWQFIPSTGRRYGLRVTRAWDERRDPERATQAALAYLRDLYRDFGQWSLALAAYNSGEGRVKSAMRQQRVRSYFQLALPKETERYLFRAYAAKLVLADPERYGFQVADEELYQPPERDRVRVRVRRRITVRAVADASGSFFREIRRLNPAITGDALPSGTYILNLPPGAARSFRLVETGSKEPGPRWIRYRVRRGDTLSAIARRHRVKLESLKQWNPFVRRRVIHPGDVIRIRLARR